MLLGAYHCKIGSVSLTNRSRQASYHLSLIISLCKVDFLFRVYPRLSLSGYPWLWRGADVSDSPPTFWRPVFLSCYFLDLCLGGCAYFCQPSLALKNNTHSHFTSYLRFLAVLCQKGFSGNKVHLIARNMSLLSRLYDILFATQNSSMKSDCHFLRLRNRQRLGLDPSSDIYQLCGLGQISHLRGHWAQRAQPQGLAGLLSSFKGKCLPQHLPLRWCSEDISDHWCLRGRGMYLVLGRVPVLFTGRCWQG